MRGALAELLALAADFDDFARGTDLTTVVYTLLSADRLRALHADLLGRLAPPAAP